MLRRLTQVSLVLVLCILISVVPQCQALFFSNSSSTAISTSTPTRHAGPPFESALSMEASILREQARSSSMPAASLPTAIQAKLPIGQMAQAVPFVQTHHAEVNATGSYSAFLPPATNHTLSRSTRSKRQSGKRVMIVGDSMSQGQQVSPSSARHQ